MNKGATVFGQILSYANYDVFRRSVRKYDGDRGVRRLSCWEQFLALVFAQLTHRESLRDLEVSLNAHGRQLYHCGFRSPAKRSTLADANESRDWRIFSEFAQCLIQQARPLYGDVDLGLNLEGTLYALDSSIIDLCLTLFPWAEFRRAKGGVKAHVLLDHDDYLPAYVLLTEAKRSDVKLADSFRLNPGSIVAIDRGYVDYALFGRWSMAEVFFVTRLKDNAAFEVVEECEIPQNRHIRADQFIRLTGAQARADYPDLLRRIVVWDAENQREIVLLTNLLEFGSTTIAAIYKERWQIELFFKALKQNLTVKTFVGTSENALRIQIWTALIALLLLKWLHHLSKANWSLSNLASMLRLNLFTYRELTQWIDNPMGTPPLIPAAEQLTLALV